MDEHHRFGDDIGREPVTALSRAVVDADDTIIDDGVRAAIAGAVDERRHRISLQPTG